MVNAELGQYHEADYPELYEKSVRRSRRVIESLFGLAVAGPENAPDEGAAMFAFVHRSNIDAFVLGVTIPRALRGMGKDKLWNWYWFGAGNYLSKRGVFPVDRENPSRASYDMSIEIARRGECQAMAPEGTHRNKGSHLGPTKIGLGRIVAKAAVEEIECPVIPVGMLTEHLSPLRPIPVVFGEPLNFMGDIETVRQRRQSAEEFDEMVRGALQHVFYQAQDMPVRNRIRELFKR